MSDELSAMIRGVAQDEAAAFDREAPYAPGVLTGFTTRIRRRRVARGATMTVGGLAVVGLIAVASFRPWSTPPAATPEPTITTEPSLTTEPTPTASAEPSTSPTATPTAVLRPAGRNLTMTDAEAMERITHPQTGERWFGTARPMNTPAWATVPESDYPRFWELGMRGEATIVGCEGCDSPFGIDAIFERAPDGSYTLIDFPSPRHSTANSTPPADDSGVPHDPDTYYDTFALPMHLSLPSGDPLTPGYVGINHGLVPTNGAADAGRTRSSSGVSFAGFEIVRDDTQPDFIWGSVYGIPLPAGLSIQEWVYSLRTPWGTEIPLNYDPLGPVAEVAWTATSSVDKLNSNHTSYVEIYGGTCCGDRRDLNSVISGSADSDWVAAGTGAGDRTVYIASARNPLLATMYRLYAEHRNPSTSLSAADGAPLSQEQFRLTPGLVAYKTPLSGSWVVSINTALMAEKMWG